MKYLKIIVSILLIIVGTLILMPNGSIEDVSKSYNTSRDIKFREFQIPDVDQKLDIKPPNLQLGNISNLNISGDISGIKFAPSISKEAVDLNKEILAVSQRYASKQPNMLKMGKHMIYYMPALSFQEWGYRPKGAEDIIACVDLTPQIYSQSQGKALQLYNHKNTFGGRGYNDGVTYSQGPLQYTEGILGNGGVIPEELGVIGSVNGHRTDKLSGKKGDRWNWYDSCNNTAKSYQTPPPIGITTPEEVVALYAMYHNFGGSIAQSGKNIDKMYNSGNIEKMTPRFAQTWCKVLASQDLVSKYKQKIRDAKITGSSSAMANIVKEWKTEAWSRMKAQHQDLIDTGYVNVNSKFVKTNYPIQILAYMLMIEGRANGEW